MVVLACMRAQLSCPVLCVVGLQSYLHVVPDGNIQLLLVDCYNYGFFFSNS